MTDLSAKPRVLLVSPATNVFAQITQIVIAQHPGYILDVVAASIGSGQTIPESWSKVLSDRDYRFAATRAMPIEEVNLGSYDAVISFASEDLCPWISGLIRESWTFDSVESDSGVVESEFSRIRTLKELEGRVEGLLQRICSPEAQVEWTGASDSNRE